MREIFGDFIDKYVLQEAELDGATVPILYEGRTADGLVTDAPGSISSSRTCSATIRPMSWPSSRRSMRPRATCWRRRC